MSVYNKLIIATMFILIVGLFGFDIILLFDSSVHNSLLTFLEFVGVFWVVLCLVNLLGYFVANAEL